MRKQKQKTDLTETILGIKAGEAVAGTHRGEAGFLFNPGLDGGLEAIVWARVLEALRVGPSDNPSDKEIEACVEACVVSTMIDGNMRRWIKRGTDWSSIRVKVLKAVFDYRDACLRMAEPEGHA